MAAILMQQFHAGAMTPTSPQHSYHYELRMCVCLWAEPTRTGRFGGSGVPLILPCEGESRKDPKDFAQKLTTGLLAV